MNRHHALSRTILLVLSTWLTTSLPAQEHDEFNVHEWNYQKKEALRNPLAQSNQFSINFTNYTEEEWCHPLPNARVISPFGQTRRNHTGTDLKTFPNDTIRAAFPGVVTLSGPHYGYGNCIVLRHANGLETLYSHNSRNLVNTGTWVQAGEPLALEGRTGRATTEHLHFEVRVQGKTIDSEIIFDHNTHTLRRQVLTFTRKKGIIQITSDITSKQEKPQTDTGQSSPKNKKKGSSKK